MRSGHEEISAPQPVGPPEGSFQRDSIEFSWSGTKDLRDLYLIVLDQSGVARQRIAVTGHEQWSSALDLDPGNYYWFVEGRSAGGTLQRTSISGFTVEAPPPD
jgi:hypothetical protein